MYANVAEIGTEELKKMVRDLYVTIFKVECYNLRDLALFWLYVGELERRGCRVEETLTINEEGGEEDESDL